MLPAVSPRRSEQGHTRFEQGGVHEGDPSKKGDRIAMRRMTAVLTVDTFLSKKGIARNSELSRIRTHAAHLLEAAWLLTICE